MIEECTVTKIKKGTAFISLVSKEKCGGCKACAFGRSNRLSVPALMKTECEVGDKVLVEMPKMDVPTSALLVYLFPLIFLAVGFIVGGLIGDIFRIIFAFVFAAIAVLPCIFIEKRLRKKQEYNPVIIEVIKSNQ